jgi:hypothetical protein
MAVRAASRTRRAGSGSSSLNMIALPACTQFIAPITHLRAVASG